MGLCRPRDGAVKLEGPKANRLSNLIGSPQRELCVRWRRRLIGLARPLLADLILFAGSAFAAAPIIAAREALAIGLARALAYARERMARRLALAGATRAATPIVSAVAALAVGLADPPVAWAGVEQHTAASAAHTAAGDGEGEEPHNPQAYRVHYNPHCRAPRAVIRSSCSVCFVSPAQTCSPESPDRGCGSAGSMFPGQTNRLDGGRTSGRGARAIGRGGRPARTAEVTARDDRLERIGRRHVTKAAYQVGGHCNGWWT